MTSVRLIALAALALCLAPAHAQIFKCEGPDGVVEYRNSPPSAQDAARCKQVQLPLITTIPAPDVPAAKPSASAKSPPPAGARPSGSEGFPKVGSAKQRERDDERRRILEEELRKEDEKLAELRKEYNNGEPERLGNERNYQKYLDRVQRLREDIARSEGNLAAIRRELDLIGK